MPLAEDLNLDIIAERLGFVGADLGLITKEAGLQAVRTNFSILRNWPRESRMNKLLELWC